MSDSISQQIYLDYPATTPCDRRVFEKMTPYFCELFGNSHSTGHAQGWAALSAIEIARVQVADSIGVDEREIVFTSGATESNILAIRGAAYYQLQKKKSLNHIVTSAIEHKSVLSCCEQLEEEGFSVTYVPVKENGVVCLEALEDSITDSTLIVSIMAVNNETGVIQPLKEIGEICEKKGVLFHSDISQAFGKIHLNLRESNLGLASFSAHKIYGPKGVGALFIRRRPLVKIRSFMVGGGQERRMRGGTVPVPLCVGFGEACKILSEEYDKDLKKILELNRILIDGILNTIPLASLNGDYLYKVPHISNFAFPFVEGESIIMGLENICLSTGSACSSTTLEPSHVLKAMNLDDFKIQSSVRFGLGRFSKKSEVEYVVEKVTETVEKLRKVSPLWDMYQDNVDFKSINWD